MDRNIRNGMIEFFKKQGLSIDSLVTEHELFNAIQKQSNIQYDSNIFEQLWERMQKVAVNFRNEPQSNISEFIEIYGQADQVLSSKIQTCQQNISYLQTQMRQGPQNSQSNTLNIFVKQINQSLRTVAVQFGYQQQMQTTNFIFQPNNQFNENLMLSIDNNQQSNQQYVTVQLIDQQFVSLGSAQFPVSEFILNNVREEVLDLYDQNGNKIGLSIVCAFQLTQGLSTQKVEKDIMDERSDMDLYQQDLINLKKPFMQIYNTNHNEYTPYQSDYQQMDDNREQDKQQYYLQDKDSEVVMEENEQQVEKENWLKQVLLVWLIVDMLVNFNRTVFHDFIIISVIFYWIRERLMTRKKVKICLAIIVVTIIFDIAWLILCGEGMWSGSMMANKYVKDVHFVQQTLDRFIVVMTYLLAIAKVIFIVFLVMYYQILIDRENEQSNNYMSNETQPNHTNQNYY